jgi:circadian clock protein KaiC
MPGDHIVRLSTGVPGLDRVLNLEGDPATAGLPEYSFNLLAGGPGAGKTTLAQQIAFANATAERRAVYFTVLGEPPLKMLRYQQAYRFFDAAKVDGAIRFVNLSEDTLTGDLGKVLERITRVVDETSPALVVVDSFRTVVRAASDGSRGEIELQGFVQRLALHLTGWQATTFLVGEYSGEEERDNPIFTVADGILWLSQSADRNSVVRKLQVLKMRGQAFMPGLHTFRITGAGVHVYPRIPESLPRVRRPPHPARASTGVAGLDAMLGGGIPAGDAVILGGPSGSGKTALATQFIAEGIRQGEPGVIAIFEEHPDDYTARARELGFDLEAMIRRGQLEIIYLRPLDLSVDEALQAIQETATRVKARRVVVDSISGFELALAPTFRQDFRESMYRMVGALTGGGVTVMLTVEVVENFAGTRFSAHEVSFLADDIIFQRYVELAGQLLKVIGVVKMRGSAHSRDLRLYEVTGHGVEIGDSLADYAGIMAGAPYLRAVVPPPVYPGLVEPEIAILQTLVALREATAPAVVKTTGLTRPSVDAALARLLALGYAIRVVDGRRAVYRPVARGPGERV